MHLLFVCLGNICRSPTAEGVMENLLARERRTGADIGAGEVTVDSAGTGSWHVGAPADARAIAAADRRGIELRSRARQVTPQDLERADLVLAMDARNAADLRALAPTPEAAGRIHLLRAFDPAAAGAGALDVPDPYLGDGDGFEAVLTQIEAACRGLLAHVRAGDPAAPSR